MGKKIYESANSLGVNSVAPSLFNYGIIKWEEALIDCKSINNTFIWCEYFGMCINMVLIKHLFITVK